MKTNLLVIFLLFIFVSGCTKTITPVDPNNETAPNRLFTSSFESNGSASIDDWVSPGPPIVKFSTDVPNGGGNYSIFLKARSLGAYVSKEVNTLKGKNNYRLTFWSKSTEDPGSLALYKINGSNKELIENLYISKKSWSQFTVDFSFTAVDNDKIQIILGGSSFKSPQGYTFFDLIDLQIVE